MRPEKVEVFADGSFFEECTLSDELKHRMEQSIACIADEKVMRRKLNELQGLRVYSHPFSCLPIVDPEIPTTDELMKLHERMIDPTRYFIWLNAMLPSDRALAKRLVSHVYYINEEVLRQTLVGRLLDSISLLNGNSLYWFAVNRMYFPKNIFDSHKDWYPSGFYICEWYADALKKQGFTEIAFSLQEKYYYSDDYKKWGNSGEKAVIKIFWKDGQFVVLVPSAHVVDFQKLSELFAIGGKVQMVHLGEDWSLGVSTKSEAHTHLPAVIEKVRSVFPSLQALYLGYGFTTKGARERIQESIAYRCGSLRVYKPYENDQPIPVVENCFPTQDFPEIINMSPYQYLRMNYQYHMEGLPSKVLCHSALSCPDNMPDVLYLGPWRDIATYPLILHPRNQ